MTPAEILARLLSVEGMEPPTPTPLFTDEPKLPVYVARMGGAVWGQGAHSDPVVAQLKAAGEALERYCLYTPADDLSVQARYGDLEGQIDPADFYCYSRAQTDNYDDEIQQLRSTAFHWTPARNAVSGASALIPRELVYVDAGELEPRRIRRESLSSGAALGTTGTQDALRRGLFELIERDAFMAVWLRNEAPQRIEARAGATRELIGWLDRYRLDCRLFHVPSEYGVPVVLALTLDHSGIGPAVTSGLSASETFATAAEAAIMESLSYRRQVRLKLMSGELVAVQNPSEIVSVETRVAYWAHSDRLSELPAWTGAQATQELRQLSGTVCALNTVLHELTVRGCRVLQADMSAPEAKAQGFEAVRVVVPELHPLYIAEDAQALYSAHLGSCAPVSRPHPFA